jgi:hypothetical protein
MRAESQRIKSVVIILFLDSVISIANSCNTLYFCQIYFVPKNVAVLYHSPWWLCHAPATVLVYPELHREGEGKGTWNRYRERHGERDGILYALRPGSESQVHGRIRSCSEEGGRLKPKGIPWVLSQKGHPAASACSILQNNGSHVSVSTRRHVRLVEIYPK